MRLQIPKLYRIASGGLAAACAMILLPLSAGYSTPAAANVTDCALPSTGGPITCGVTYEINGQEIGRTNWIPSAAGDVLTLNVVDLVNSGDGWAVDSQGLPTWTSGGLSFTIESLTAEVDPVIPFAYSLINNTANPASAGATQFTPINGLTGVFTTHAEIDTTVNPISPTTVGTVGPTSGGGFIVDSQDIRTVPTFSSLDKGVDIGLPCTKTDIGSCLETKNGTITLDGTYETFSVDVGFIVSANTIGQVAGEVSQQLIPEPSTYALMLAGVAFIGFVARRRLSA